MNLLKRLGFNKEKETLRFPHEESYPKPPMGYRGHLVLSSLPPLPEGGEVEEQAVVTDDNQGASRPESGVGDSHKSAASLEKEAEAEVSSSTRSSLPAASPKGKRKRGDAIDSGTSKVNTSRAGKAALDAEEETLDLYGAALVSSDDEEENAPIDETARTSTSRTLVISEARPDGGRTHQEYELENPEDDELLDALSLLEIHGTEARNGLDEAETGLSRLFPYFFHKKEQPATFIDLAQCFNGEEDLGLQLRQEGLKVGVEGTMALIAESQQQVDWSKVGDTEKIETKKWQSLIKAAKPNSKKILATLGYKPASAPSSTKPELIFDNYTATPGPSDVFPSSLLKKTPASVEFVENSSSDNSTEDLEELRQQLQSVKKQSLMLMEQSRKSSEREKIALQQAQAAIAEKDSAVAEAAAASSRENSTLQLLIDASLDMAGSFLDATTEDERVEARSNVLLRLAREHGSNFWGTPERTRQIVGFKIALFR
ncbi:hypothetical protein QYE76_054435 [Lolium multiflorum]|uniref:Uncharacterized protein n=1 Tax=Lolium multiflorum TaxID=4521 RepID=A0AAD8SZ55_LOLMU|nr:hypothetical protein QYE76_054435 [Lolium multiflorum]